MTQARSLPTLSLQLTSQQLLETVHPTKEEFLSLLLRPGEPSDVLVQLENLWNRPIRWKLEVDGDFPNNWCQWLQEESEEIAPSQKVNKKISFQLPLDFFENQYVLDRKQSSLKLDYESQIRVYADGETKQQLVGYENFYLSVRPPCSYLNFLPAFYKEVDFLERFLTIFEQAFDPTVQALDVLWAYLDPLTAPESMLPFLAHWVAWDIDKKKWSLKQQRRLIRNAATLYRWHGTRFGLRFYLHLCTGLPLDEELPEADKHISIEEIFSEGFVLGKTIIGQNSMFGGGKHFHFVVRLRVEDHNSIDEPMVREVIEREKPAFCTYELDIITRPRTVFETETEEDTITLFTLSSESVEPSSDSSSQPLTPTPSLPPSSQDDSTTSITIDIEPKSDLSESEPTEPDSQKNPSETSKSDTDPSSSTFSSVYPPNDVDVTKIQIRVARLFHVQTQTAIDLPFFPIIYIGKPNEQKSPDIDVSTFPNADVVSRTHALIRAEGEIFYLEDLNSSNGTFINNISLLPNNPQQLQSGDRISLGKGDAMTFIFQLTDEWQPYQFR